MNDTPSASFEALLRRQQNFASKRVNRLVTLNSLEFRIVEPLTPKTGDEDPFQRARPPFEFFESLLIRVVTLLFATDGSIVSDDILPLKREGGSILRPHIHAGQY